MDGGKRSRNARKVSSDRRSDRKSATGMNGDPKKGGRGGKFTWEGADGYTDEDLGLVSKNIVSKNSGGSNANKTCDEDGEE